MLKAALLTGTALLFALVILKEFPQPPAAADAAVARAYPASQVITVIRGDSFFDTYILCNAGRVLTVETHRNPWSTKIVSQYLMPRAVTCQP